MKEITQSQNLFDTLTSQPWDCGTGRKMLFLTKRYYVFNNEHELLDGGVVRYNKTLEKIFIRNEDLRGEIFISQVSEDVLHLHGSVHSKLAGIININHLLHAYAQKLVAPLSRVAKVEKYLRPSDIYHILIQSEEINEYFLKTFENSLYGFSDEQSRKLYIKFSPEYFKNFELRVLKRISLYFSACPANDKLYQELFMFLMALQNAYENNFILKYDLDFFLNTIKDRLLKAYEDRPAGIPLKVIHECLFCFKLHSFYLPSPQQCIKELYSKDLEIQLEHANYLSLMKEDAKVVEEEIFKRLVDFYKEKFYAFKNKLSKRPFYEQQTKKVVTDLGTQLALISALGSCKSDNKEVHIFFLFLLSNNEGRVREASKKAFIQFEGKALNTFNSLGLKDDVLQFIKGNETSPR